MIKALLVDDEYFVRKGLLSTMPWERYGIEMIGEASNGVKALEFMQEHAVELLITDLSMPIMNGFELMQQARQVDPTIQMVVLSCHEDFKYIQDALRLGAIDYIVKTELEEESMQEALQRIADRITPRMEIPPSVEAAVDEGERSEFDEEQLLVHTKEWLQMTWIMQDEQFDYLLVTLKQVCPELTRIQHVIHYLLMEWSRFIPAAIVHQYLPKVKKIKSWAAYDSFMRQLRHDMQEHIHLLAYPEDVVERIMQAVQLAKLNLSTTMTQSYLAYQLKLNRGYFSKAFKDVVGQSFQDFMKEQRLARAQYLLIHSSKSIAEIAEECGFLDQRYFSRLFRKETGKLPSAYRNG